MRIVPRPLVGLILCAAAAAQFPLDATFVADTDLVCETRWFNQPTVERLPRGTDLKPGANVSVGVGNTASTQVSYSSSRHALRAEIADRADRPFGPHRSTATGTHQTLLTLRAARPTQVRIVLSCAVVKYEGSAGVWADYEARVDLDDNGTWDYVAAPSRTSSREFSVVVDASGFAIRSETRSSARDADNTSLAYAFGTLLIEALPTPALGVEFEAATPINCLANAFNWPSLSLPTGSVLRPSLDALVGPRNNGIDFHTSLTQQPTGWQAVVKHFGAGQMVFFGSGASVIDPHDLLLTVRSPTSRPARVRLAITASTSGPGPVAYDAQIDVGDDGTFDLIRVLGQTVTKEIPVTLTAAGLAIRVRAHGSAGEQSMSVTTFAGELQIELLPALNCTATHYGSACGASPPAIAAAANLDNMLDVGLTSAPPNAAGGLLIGLTRVDLPLPFSTCRLYTDVLVFAPFMTDANGQASQWFGLPVGVPLSLNLQQVILDASSPPRLVATRGLQLNCN